MRRLYMAIDLSDEYELPIAVADSAQELSLMMGLTRNAVSSWIINSKRRGCRCKYIAVEIDDDDD